MKENVDARGINFPEVCAASLLLVAMFPGHEPRAPDRHLVL
jgi:hypothetical protein